MNENKNNEVIFVGLPNSGKSTLINTLTRSKTSIVGSKPNTTRDKISTKIVIKNKDIIRIKIIFNLEKYNTLLNQPIFLVLENSSSFEFLCLL